MPISSVVVSDVHVHVIRVLVVRYLGQQSQNAGSARAKLSQRLHHLGSGLAHVVRQSLPPRWPASTRCGLRPAPAGPAWWRAAHRGCTGRRCPRLQRLWCTRCGPRPAPAGLGGLRGASRGCTGRRCARLQRPWSTRCGPRPAPADPAGRRAAPEADLRVRVPGFGGLVYQVRASASSGGSSLVASSTPRLYCAPVCPASAAWSTRCGPRPAPAGPASWREAPRGYIARRCARPRRPWSTRCGPRPARAGRAW